jgi:hypothetical protein
METKKLAILTGIYVHDACTVTIRAIDKDDATVEIVRYGRNFGGNEPAVGTLELERGIYAIASNAYMDITGVSGQVVARPNNKDEWPDPQPGIVALEPGASGGLIRAFFASIAKDF